MGAGRRAGRRRRDALPRRWARRPHPGEPREQRGDRRDLQPSDDLPWRPDQGHRHGAGRADGGRPRADARARRRVRRRGRPAGHPARPRVGLPRRPVPRRDVHGAPRSTTRRRARGPERRGDERPRGPARVDPRVPAGRDPVAARHVRGRRHAERHVPVDRPVRRLASGWRSRASSSTRRARTSTPTRARRSASSTPRRCASSSLDLSYLHTETEGPVVRGACARTSTRSPRRPGWASVVPAARRRHLPGRSVARRSSRRRRHRHRRPSRRRCRAASTSSCAAFAACADYDDATRIALAGARRPLRLLARRSCSSPTSAATACSPSPSNGYAGVGGRRGGRRSAIGVIGIAARAPQVVCVAEPRAQPRDGARRSARARGRAARAGARSRCPASRTPQSVAAVPLRRARRG